jgi:hypothetical protein
MGSGELAVKPVGIELGTLLWTEIRVQQELFRDLASLHAPGEPNFLLHRQEIGVTDFLQIKTNRISNPRRQVFRVCRPIHGTLWC